MDSQSKASQASRMRWVALIVLTSINLLNYIDRYIFSALAPAIQKDLGINDTELGVLGSAFILAYLVISPVFGFMGDRGGRPRLMSMGLALWSGATAFSGIAMTFTGQLITRITVGVGESAYSVIAPSVIADYFGKASRGKTFAIYSGAIPVGSALGYVLGGFLEPRLGWQHSFFVVGVPGILLAVLLFFMKDPPREQVASASHARSKLSLKQTYKTLFANGGFLFTVLGYAAYTFVVGGMAFWMPTYIVRYFEGITLEKGNLIFGGVTVVGGFIGTVFGGWLADRIERRSGNGYLKVSVISMVLAVPLFIYMLRLTDFNHFAAVLFVMDIALFMCISPLDAAVINYVRPGLRSTAMALNIFLIHFLGDGISRGLMGAVSDASGLRTAISLLPWGLVVAGLLWALGMILYWQPLGWPAQALLLPRYQAHRGFRPDASVIENTLAAFQKASASGAEMTECDVQLSKDGEVVVFHDFDLKRLGGGPELLHDLTAAELKARTGAPLLRELLADPASPRLVNIELKTREVISRSGLEVAVVRVVKETGAESRVLFSSFNPFSLRRLSKLAPNIPRALLVSERPDPSNKIYLRKMWLGLWARPHLLHLDDGMLVENRIAAWTDRGVPLAAWTINDPSRATQLLNQGVRSVISDTLFK